MWKPWFQSLIGASNARVGVMKDCEVLLTIWRFTASMFVNALHRSRWLPMGSNIHASGS